MSFRDLAATPQESWIASRVPLPDLLERLGRVTKFTAAWNVTGQPALSLPLAWSADGLPPGMQLVGGVGREDVLLRVGAQLEAARPWAERRPAIHA